MAPSESVSITSSWADVAVEQVRPVLFRDPHLDAHHPRLCIDDLTTLDREMAVLTGIAYGGVT